MECTAIISDIGIDYKTNKAKITFLFDNKEVLHQAEELQDKKLNVQAKKWYKKRSKNANAYLWVLIEKLSENRNISRLEVYRKHILEAGSYQELQMPEEAMKKFSKVWASNGLGWFCDKSINEYGEIILRAYYGSSTYDTKEMTRLLNSVIQDCLSLGIETKTKEEIESLLREWELAQAEVKKDNK